MKTTLLFLCILGCALCVKADIPPSGEAYPFDCFQSPHDEEEHRCVTEYEDTDNGLSCLLMLCGQSGYYPFLILNLSDPENKYATQAICELAHDSNADHVYTGDVTITLTNGATLPSALACTVEDRRLSTLYPERREDNDPEIQIYLSLAPTEDDLLPNFTYHVAVTRLLTYDIAEITVNGTSVPLTGYRSAATLRAMFKTLAKATGDSKTFAYTPPAQTATTSSSRQQSSRPTAPAELPGTLSVSDMVNHPFGLLDTDITYNSAIQALRRQTNWELSNTDNLIGTYDYLGYKASVNDHPVTSAHAYFSDNRLYSYGYELFFPKNDNARQALADAKAFTLRMESQLKEMGIDMREQGETYGSLYRSEGHLGNKQITIQYSEASYRTKYDAYCVRLDTSIP